MIIGISGKIGSGKDETARVIQSLTRDNWEVKKFADKLKQVCHILCGGDIADQFSREGKSTLIGPYKKTIGEIQQLVGTNAMRDNFDKDVWVKSLFVDYAKDEVGRFPHWIVTDCRFPNEAEAIKSKGGVLLRLDGDPCGIRKNSVRDLNHPSETALDNYRGWDGMIYNTSTIEDLEAAVREFLSVVEAEKGLTFNWR